MGRNKKILGLALVLVLVVAALVLYFLRQRKLLLLPGDIFLGQPTCPFVNWQISPFEGEKYFRQFALRGRISQISGSEIFVSKNLVPLPVSPEANVSQDRKEVSQRKIKITDQTQVSLQSNILFTNPIEEPRKENEATLSTPPLPTLENQLKEGSLSDLKVGDIIFVLSSDNVLKEKEVRAIKIVREQRNKL